MGGATFEYPGRSCLQETDSPDHGDRNRGTSKPSTTQGTSKPYPFSGAQGASAPRKGCYVTQSNASTNGACPRTNACENVSNTIEQVRGTQIRTDRHEHHCPARMPLRSLFSGNTAYGASAEQRKGTRASFQLAPVNRVIGHRRLRT